MKTTEQQALFAIAITVIASYLYFLVVHKINGVKTGAKSNIIVRMYMARKLTGFVILGFIPALIAFLIFNFQPFQETKAPGISLRLWALMIGVSILLILLNRINSRSAALQAMYPEMRLQNWNFASFIIAAGGWILYLSGYEYLFRGLLLSSCINAFGMWPAVVINLALYSTLHLPKGLKESIAAIPFGALLCFLTIESNAVLPAIILHSVQAISVEIWCIRQNKEMSF